MPEYTPNAVASLANERISTAENEARQSPRVRAAQAALDSAQATRDAYPYSDDAVQGVIDAQTALNRATNEFWREKRMRQLEADRAEKARAVEEAQRQNEREQEERAKAEKLAAWLSAGFSMESFQKSWPERWEAERIRRADLQEQELKKALPRMTGNAGF